MSEFWLTLGCTWSSSISSYKVAIWSTGILPGRMWGWQMLGHFLHWSLCLYPPPHPCSPHCPCLFCTHVHPTPHEETPWAEMISWACWVMSANTHSRGWKPLFSLSLESAGSFRNAAHWPLRAFWFSQLVFNCKIVTSGRRQDESHWNFRYSPSQTCHFQTSMVNSALHCQATYSRNFGTFPLACRWKCHWWWKPCDEQFEIMKNTANSQNASIWNMNALLWSKSTQCNGRTYWHILRTNSNWKNDSSSHNCQGAQTLTYPLSLSWPLQGSLHLLRMAVYCQYTNYLRPTD